MNTNYCGAFIEQAIVKLLSRGDRTVQSVAQELNVNYHTAKNWIKRGMASQAGVSPAREKRPQDWQERIGPVTVHYAGAYTGYGPILSGDAWLKYFTIRAIFDTGLTLNTEWRGKMVRGPKRHAKASVGQPSTVEQLAALQDIQHETVIAADAGLGAELFRLPANTAQRFLPIAGSVGQFIFVLGGTALVEGTTLALWDSAFLPAPDGEVAITAGAQGAEVIALHMPETAEPYLPQSTSPATTESRQHETSV